MGLSPLQTRGILRGSQAVCDLRVKWFIQLALKPETSAHTQVICVRTFLRNSTRVVTLEFRSHTRQLFRNVRIDVAWLFAHYEWVVAVVAMLIVSLLLKHWIDSRKKTTVQPSRLELFNEKQWLEEELGSLEAQIPSFTVVPAIKIGKNDTDFLREKIERKKKEIIQIDERMKLLPHD